MNELDQYLITIKNENHRQCLKDVINWVSTTFPDLSFKIAWNQPMFTHHDTFIIGFSASSKLFTMCLKQKQYLYLKIEKKLVVIVMILIYSVLYGMKKLIII